MGINKHAWIRYQKLDECLGNTGKNFGIPELHEACNEALIEYYPNSNGICKRQVYIDIDFMESSQGWSVDIEKRQVGKRVYYRYTDPSFSIRNQKLNQAEAEELHSAFMVLSRFKGLPQFEWIEEMQVRLENELGLKEHSRSIVSFQENPYLKGRNHFGRLFNAIYNRQALEITYQGFRQTEPSKFVFHPWYLKEFNSRWFLFGRNIAYDYIMNLPLDRIEDIHDSNEPYLENNEIDFDQYFDDIVGVTLLESEELTKIELQVGHDVAPYIETKPLHGSQKVKKTADSVIFSIEVIPNFELEKLILSHGEQIKVLSPESFRKRIEERLVKSLRNYSS
jgi:predicted DNA-binding transcriptional regulator YafY